MTYHDTIVAAVPRKVYANAHAYHINSISINSDGETYMSADDLRVNLWNLNISDQSFSEFLVSPSPLPFSLLPSPLSRSLLSRPIVGSGRAPKLDPAGNVGSYFGGVGWKEEFIDEEGGESSRSSERERNEGGSRAAADF